MENLAAWIGIGLVAFASTNIDDLFVLVGFYSLPEYRAWQVVLGQFAGIGTLIAISTAGSMLSLVIPRHWIGLLGLVPILIGALRLAARRRNRSEEGPDPSALARSAGAGGLRNALVVALVTISNGSDNVATYLPLFASADAGRRRALTILFLVLIAVWCAIGRAMVSHRRWGDRVRYHGGRLLPYILIVLGSLLVFRTSL